MRRWIAAGCAGLVLALGFTAASPQLHHWVHSDAGLPGHECAVTLFIHGISTAAVAVTVAAAPPAHPARLFALPEAPLAAPAHYRLLPGRAPPAG